MIFDSIYFNCSYARTLIIYELNDIISLHAFFFLFIYISNSHSHSHFYIRGHLYLFTLLPLNCVPTQPLLHRDAIFRTSRRSHRYVGTQFQMHREGVKNTENPGCNSERRTFRFVKYLSVVFGIVNFLPVCASTV